MEKIVFAFLVLCIVLFIGEVCVKEAFADCKSPGGLTWTIKMTPGSGNVSSDSDKSDDLTGEDDDLDSKIRDNTFRFHEDYFLSPRGELGDFLNHSCKPNAYVLKKKNKLFIYSLNDISLGDEILID